ncbi:hypothetical protein F971_01513 [Acinetobacter vivianii]|uniref:Tyr recombinase domain-containing protein n=1 Tax=Acinetobacter vivianii TaxID=1776742 RepID=N8UY89_9GAMM|nr:site-specific integrase [Acinetobacter vivianii]ENU92531.1 hypothetical protein F971_01513 [Acinetobacter vivianii]
MSAGIEFRGNSMRMWINYKGKHIKEPIDWPMTTDSKEQALRWAELVTLEIKMGRFELVRHFPNSKNLIENQISHYAKIYLEDIKKEVAPSTYASYEGHVKNHINPKWGKLHPEEIETKQVKKWIKQLKETHSSKTIREITTRFSQIHAVWRDENKVAFDPFQNITIHQADTPEPDPFTKAEINKILETETDLDIEHLLPCLFWTGLSMSEQIPIAWEDINLEKGTIQINRSYVRGVYRVTKNRRRKREIKLLQPALDALRKQYQKSGNARSNVIEVLQRDNHSYKTERLRFVWLNRERNIHFEYHELRYRWGKHLQKSKVRKRGINQGRHTFASQLLSSGQVPPEWIAEQLGHADTSMIYKHYGKLIAEDMPDYLSKINRYIQE